MSGQISTTRKSVVPLFLLIASVSAVIAYCYFQSVAMEEFSFRLARHHQILSRQAVLPYNNRILAPALTELFARFLQSAGGISEEVSWLVSYFVYQFLCIMAFLSVLFVYLKQWHGSLLAFCGVMFCAALLPISLRDHNYQPWSLLEAGLFCTAMLAAYKKHFVAMIAITLVATLNRETGIFIPAIYFFGTIDLKRAVKKIDKIVLLQVGKTLSLIALSTAVLLILYRVQGVHGYYRTFEQIWEKNLRAEHLVESFTHITLFAGAAWVFAVMGFKKADAFSRQMVLLVPFYLIPIFIWGNWWEVRLLIDLYPIIISLALFFLGPYFEKPRVTSETECEVQKTV